MSTSGTHSRKALRVMVRGNVQGVGLRYRAHWKAEELDLTGWARNLPDGTVQLHLEGMGYRIDMFMAWLRGPIEGVHIRRIDSQPVALEGMGEFRAE